MQPRINSRPWKLSMMKPGDRLLFEANTRCGLKLMQQIGVDARRVGMRSKLTMTLALGIELRDRQAFDIVIVERLQEIPVGPTTSEKALPPLPGEHRHDPIASPEASAVAKNVRQVQALHTG